MHPSCRAILLSIPRSKCLPHRVFWVPPFTSWSGGVGVPSEKQQAAKSTGKKGAAGHPLCSHCTARCSQISLSSCSPTLLHCPDSNLYFAPSSSLAAWLTSSLKITIQGTRFIRFALQTSFFEQQTELLQCRRVPEHRRFSWCEGDKEAAWGREGVCQRGGERPVLLRCDSSRWSVTK